MVSKLELDFEFWKFWSFTLLALVITLGVAFFTMVYQSYTWAPVIGWVTVGVIILWMLSLIMFYVNYNKFRKTLK
jgi:predicted ferric reductase